MSDSQNEILGTMSESEISDSYTEVLQDTPPTRYDNWPQLLNQYIAKVRDNKYEMGTFDCCIFVSGAVKAITGHDPMKEIRGKYDQATYKDALVNLGEGTLAKTLVKKFGKSIHGAKGQRGDICYHENRCGICIGRQGMFIMTEGFGFIPMTQVRAVFKVGR